MFFSVIWLVVVVAIIVVTIKKNAQQNTRPGQQRPMQQRPMQQAPMQQWPGQQGTMATGRPPQPQPVGGVRGTVQQATRGYGGAGTQADIMARARQNVTTYAQDTTMTELEQSHGHSARVSSTGVMEYQQAQREAHPHDAAHVAAELDAREGMSMDMVEDLMVKGYDAKLSYERDFVAEAMDMINGFIYQ